MGLDALGVRRIAVVRGCVPGEEGPGVGRGLGPAAVRLLALAAAAVSAGGLRERRIGFLSLHEALDTTTPGGRLVFHVFAALAEFIRELIVQGTHEGLAAARARGERIGRPPAMTPEQIRHARALLTDPENSVTSIVKLLGISRTTLYKYVPELTAGRDSLIAEDNPTLPA
ncbi:MULTISPECIES: recombinase family protein [Streptomyces violaceusniger group]|uniref:Recombinase family protein n=2 Tax=Streptomyces violaceusniger group TaxID=2839105 RepID=A0ABD5JL55_9ACTN|nr:recombinase family protein [Streptomyces violaceusniger]MEE4589168.1 recombinase family protein [Streptomyces sp. DSM 41602]